MEQNSNPKLQPKSETLVQIIKKLKGNKYINLDKLLDQIVREITKHDEFKSHKEEDLKREA